MSVSNEVVFLIVGTILFLIGLLGGGYKIGKFKMSIIDKYWRGLSAIIGVTCMGIAAYQALKPTSPLPIPTSSPPTPFGDLGWVTISGVVRDASGAPLAGEKVYCELCSGTRYTGADGRFSYEPIYLRESDLVMMWVLSSKYDMQEIKRSGLETWKNPNFDIVLSQVVAPENATDVAGFVGWVTVLGTVHDADGAPLRGERVDCLVVTDFPRVYSYRNTNVNGSFSCSPIFLGEDDMLSVQVLASGYAEQEIKRSAVEARNNQYFEFVFSQLVTPTAYVPYDPRTPSPTPYLQYETPTLSATP